MTTSPQSGAVGGVKQGGEAVAAGRSSRGRRERLINHVADVGCEKGTAVAPDCDANSSAFTGTINWIELKLGEDDHSHLLDPGEHLNMLMGRQ